MFDIDTLLEDLKKRRIIVRSVKRNDSNNNSEIRSNNPRKVVVRPVAKKVEDHTTKEIHQTPKKPVPNLRDEFDELGNLEKKSKVTNLKRESGVIRNNFSNLCMELARALSGKVKGKRETDKDEYLSKNDRDSEVVKIFKEFKKYYNEHIKNTSNYHVALEMGNVTENSIKRDVDFVIKSFEGGKIPKFHSPRMWENENPYENGIAPKEKPKSGSEEYHEYVDKLISYSIQLEKGLNSGKYMENRSFVKNTIEKIKNFSIKVKQAEGESSLTNKNYPDIPESLWRLSSKIYTPKKYSPDYNTKVVRKLLNIVKKLRGPSELNSISYENYPQWLKGIENEISKDLSTSDQSAVDKIKEKFRNYDEISSELKSNIRKLSKEMFRDDFTELNDENKDSNYIRKLSRIYEKTMGILPELGERGTIDFTSGERKIGRQYTLSEKRIITDIIDLMKKEAGSLYKMDGASGVNYDYINDEIGKQVKELIKTGISEKDISKLTPMLSSGKYDINSIRRKYSRISGKYNFTNKQEEVIKKIIDLYSKLKENETRSNSEMPDIGKELSVKKANLINANRAERRRLNHYNGNKDDSFEDTHVAKVASDTGTITDRFSKLGIEPLSTSQIVKIPNGESFAGIRKIVDRFEELNADAEIIKIGSKSLVGSSKCIIRIKWPKKWNHENSYYLIPFNVLEATYENRKSSLSKSQKDKYLKPVKTSDLQGEDKEMYNRILNVLGKSK